MNIGGKDSRCLFAVLSDTNVGAEHPGNTKARCSVYVSGVAEFTR